MTLMENKLLVNTPGGEMLSRHVCPNICITIRGVDFPSHLIVLDSKGIDVILGMDWLSKYHGVIDCAQRMMKVKHTDGTEIEYQALLGILKEAKVNQTGVILDI